MNQITAKQIMWTDNDRVVEIRIDDRPFATVEARKKFGSASMSPPGINWGCFGTCDVELTKVAALAMLDCVRVAEVMPDASFFREVLEETKIVEWLP